MGFTQNIRRTTGNILLTGPPGIGKSTAIRAIAESLGPEEAGGFWSGEIREGGRRVGFGITTLQNQQGVLAHIGLREGPLVSRYRVHLQDMAQIAVPSMKTAREVGKIVIIDEIARMELYSDLFRQEVLLCLDAGCVIGTIQQRGDPFLDSVRSRADVKLIVMNSRNRDSIPDLVLSSLSSSCGSKWS